MAPSPSPNRRLALLACAALGAAVLLLPGCGDDSPTAAGGAPTESTKTAASGRAHAPAGCPGPVEAFADSLVGLRRQLAIGLSYDQYAAKVRNLKRSYAQLPIDRLAIDCLSTTATPAELAFNRYIDAANAWGECLADASCTTASIEPFLQRRWRIASRFLTEAQ